MDFGSIFKSVSLFTRFSSYIPTIQRVVARGVSVNAIEHDIDDPDVRAILRDLAAKLFPSVRPELLAAAGAVTLSKDYVMKLQGLLNQVSSPSPGLDVDGDYGNLTRAAVVAYQKANGLVADEFAGDATMAALTADAVKIIPTHLGGGGEAV